VVFHCRGWVLLWVFLWVFTGFSLGFHCNFSPSQGVLGILPLPGEILKQAYPHVSGNGPC